jgi:D-alanyl-D-alanine carboxypeptidase
VKRAALGWLGCLALLACEQPSKQGAKVERTAPPTASARTASVIVPTPSAIAPPLPGPPPAIAPPAAPTATVEPASLCNEQAPQPFLAGAHFDSFNATGGTAREWKQLLDKAVRYRTEQYGYVKGFGDEAWNVSTAAEQTRVVTFFGVPVSIHRRIAPALSCVETAIRAQCADHQYQPYVLSGFRKRNTYLNGEVSNHVYGIALDVDPSRNPCCGCVGEWRASERCQNDKTKFQRMDMPRCWVTEFERFGFYWLGHSKLEDTMHFEFLADPGQIVRQARLVR